MILENNERNWTWHSVSMLTIFWFVSVSVVIISGFFQKEFFNPEALIPFFSITILVSIFLSISILFYDYYKKINIFWWGLYLGNALLISLILVKVSWNQTLFFFLYLINILASGLSLKSKGSYLVGLISLIGYNFSILISPQNKLFFYISSIVVNNCSLILVSYLSGQLSDYLETLGLRLDIAHRDIRKIKNIHELILSHIPSGVLTVDSQGHLLQWNPQAEAILSKSTLATRELWDSFYTRLCHINKNELGVIEFSINRDSDLPKIIRLQRALFRFSDTNEQSEVFVIDDVTRLREIEENLRNQEKLAAIGKLAAGIAHEIRNPLASISGSVQMLSVQAGTEEDKKLFNIVIRETDRLNLLITEFLDYAKPLPPPTDVVKVKALLVEVMELLQFNKKLSTKVKLECQWPDEFMILGYKDKLKQAFLNIIINAYQALEQINDPLFLLRLSREDDQVVVRFKDNGCGMKEETRKRIFEPFFTTKAKGTGLGLAVTHKIFEAHGASIIVESKEGLGTEFVIKIKEYVRIT